MEIHRHLTDSRAIRLMRSFYALCRTGAESRGCLLCWRHLLKFRGFTQRTLTAMALSP